MRIITIFKDLDAECTERLMCMCYIHFWTGPEMKAFSIHVLQDEETEALQDPLLSLAGAVLIVLDGRRDPAVHGLP